MTNTPSVVGKLAASAILLAFVLPTNAIEITYQGSASGNFSDPVTANFLSFTGTSFGPGVTSGGSALVDLGTFTVTLPSSAAIQASGNFNLNVIFTTPGGASLASSIVAAVAGTLNKNHAHNVFLDFGPGQTINFSGLDGNGSFFIAVNDVRYPNGSASGAHQTLTGSISNAVFSPLSTPTPLLAPTSVPEPGSLALLGLGLAGLGLNRRRRAN